MAETQGFERRAILANGFELTVFENAAFLETSPPLAARPELPDTDTHAVPPDRSPGDGRPGDVRVLHVYLEGDGTPWMYRVIVTRDPTPRRPLMLGLMALDTAPALYVGRPCYNGTSLDVGCESALWTSARYSEAVVDSMAAAIRTLAERQGFERIRLFGHSGGGTLALLLAARLPGTLDVVTIAGNLDPDAWTRHHGYTPLRDSLNPSLEPAFGSAVHEWHLLGGDDRVVPPALVRPFILSRERAIGVDFPTFSHGCCWQRVWPGVLRAVTRGEPALMPGRVFGGGTG